jgi:glycine cleavage system transcriptional repressor
LTENLAMQKNFVLTVTGPDRIGIVERVTGHLFAQGGNVETSRMARLGGEFAILMLVSIPEDRIAALDVDLEALAAIGYKVTTTATDRTHAGTRPDWRPYRIEVEGADDEGIIHEVAHYLSEQGINIESVDSETTPAPVSGSPLFSMIAQIVVPPSLAGTNWEAGLDEIADHKNLEIRVFPLHEERD